MLNSAFEIGFDHYRFSLPLEISRFPYKYRPEIRNGFEAARIQQVSTKKPDLYEKKLLSIRDRALAKNLTVTIGTVDLRREFAKTRGVCPVTKIPFTFAENDATDWSVDRIDNDRGYCPDNIVIVSVCVNQAKSDLDLAGIIKATFAPHKDADVLSLQEWFRMAKFYFKRMRLNKPLSFCQLLSNRQVFYEHLVFIQLFYSKRRKSQVFLSHLAQYLGKDAVQKAAKLASKRAYHRGDIEVEVLYNSPKLYHSVQSFIQVINSHSKEFDPLLMNCLFA